MDQYFKIILAKKKELKSLLLEKEETEGEAEKIEQDYLQSQLAIGSLKSEISDLENQKERVLHIIPRIFRKQKRDMIIFGTINMIILWISIMTAPILLGIETNFSLASFLFSGLVSFFGSAFFYTASYFFVTHKEREEMKSVDLEDIQNRINCNSSELNKLKSYSGSVGKKCDKIFQLLRLKQELIESKQQEIAEMSRRRGEAIDELLGSLLERSMEIKENSKIKVHSLKK